MYSILTILPLLACSERVVDAPPGQPGGACREGDEPCDPGLACSEAGSCFDEASPCAGYDCGGGTCRVVDDTPFCECAAGTIHAIGAAPCRSVSLEVAPRPGIAGGLCLAPDGQCEDGFVCQRDENYCYVPEDPCVGFACGGVDRGRCEPLDGRPSCSCFDGFDNEPFSLYCCPSAGDGGDPRCA
jgi:hypothetical protein